MTKSCLKSNVHDSKLHQELSVLGGGNENWNISDNIDTSFEQQLVLQTAVHLNRYSLASLTHCEIAIIPSKSIEWPARNTRASERRKTNFGFSTCMQISRKSLNEKQLWNARAGSARPGWSDRGRFWETLEVTSAVLGGMSGQWHEWENNFKSRILLHLTHCCWRQLTRM